MHEDSITINKLSWKLLELVIAMHWTYFLTHCKMSVLAFGYY